jgi:hypothetical protein
LIRAGRRRGTEKSKSLGCWMETRPQGGHISQSAARVKKKSWTVATLPSCSIAAAVSHALEKLQSTCHMPKHISLHVLRRSDSSVESNTEMYQSARIGHHSLPRALYDILYAYGASPSVRATFSTPDPSGIYSVLCHRSAPKRPNRVQPLAFTIPSHPSPHPRLSHKPSYCGSVARAMRSSLTSRLNPMRAMVENNE